MSFLFAWAVISLVSAQDASLKSLTKPVSVRLKNCPIGEALAQIDPALLLSPSIADLKVTVFVKDVPEGKVLEKIADVLGCEWKAEKVGFRLILPASDYSQLQAYLRAEDALLQKRAKAEIDELMQLTAAPLEDLKKQLQDLNKSGKPYKEVGEQRRQLLIGTDPRQRLIGDLFRRFGANDWGAFWRGQIMTAEMPDAPDGKKGFRSAIQFNPTLQQLTLKSSAGPGGALLGLHYVVMLVPFLKPPDELANQPFAMKVLDWPTPDAALEANTDLKKPFGEAVPLSDSPYYRRERPIADLLENVFDRSGRPIVADGFRTGAFFDGSPAGNLFDWIALTKKYFPSFLKIDGDWLLMRHSGFWRRRLVEPSEATLRNLEKQEKPSLADYANFAAKLTPGQTMSFLVGLPPVTRFNPNPLIQAGPALRFYGSLSPSQRGASTVPYSDLNAVQQGLFRDALSSGVFANADDLSWESGLIDGRTPSGLAFFAAAGKVFPYGHALPGGRNVNGSAGVSPEDQKVDGAIFLFGIDKERRVGYTTPVSPNR